MVGIEDLDSKSKDIIWALSQMGGKANTSEIRRYTDIDNTTIINYRLKGKLGPDQFGLVETEQPPMGDGPLPAKIATLTDAGHEFADELYSQSVTDAESLVKEIERLQNRVDDLESELQAGETNSEPDDVDERIDTIWNATIAIRDYLIEEHDANLEQYHPRNR
ncbi:hypothetical protein SAMN04487949_2901 [Halogranum gelatinilyticum]|uniref:Uncharacterized protein n=1 Tax=Halogranum gelatinilyticum TaxID=660521 RepID=A0A1G9X9S2_9EURY|nr:hypothetical protein [Halogranum gelatinilyticum]SDM93488.1 hypothetical protein SAMN04487949_2901 [Halogranum gelatinilyticum]